MERLDSIVGVIKQSGLILDNHSEDGRVNSIANEDQIIDLLINEFDFIRRPVVRNWYDMEVVLNDIESLYVNIKVSNLLNSAADNVSSKLGMGYALTGIKTLPIVWGEFNRLVAQNLRVGYDYYFLIIDKSDIRQTFWTSLKRINTLVSNGNNLPFQCNWAENRVFSTRTELQAMRYILEKYVESWDKKAKGYPHELKSILERNEILD